MSDTARRMVAASTWQALEHPVILGDSLEVLADFPDESIDAVVTDPPYGLAFMGAGWDAFDARAFQRFCEQWARECCRVLKPGGHLLAFGGTRTYHRLACAVEDAGFEIRDRTLTLSGHTIGAELDWLYGSGWPKSRDIGKAIDKRAGAEREVVGRYQPPDGQAWNLSDDTAEVGYQGGHSRSLDVTAPATPEAAEWEGWGTALKPAHEPIVVARKPFRVSVEANVLEHGTGALNIDAARIAAAGGNPSVERRKGKTPLGGSSPTGWKNRVNGDVYAAERAGELLGRWPANVALVHAPGCELVGERKVPAAVTVRRNAVEGDRDPGIFAKRKAVGPDVTYGDEDGMETVEAWACAEGCPVADIDRQSGPAGASAQVMGTEPSIGRAVNVYGSHEGREGRPAPFYADQGGASRFFYSGKANPAEREYGLEALAAPEQSASFPRPNGWEPRNAPRNVHPTVKPLELMRWLVRLVCPPDGIVLDPFAGSNSTGCACALEGVGYVGVEREPNFAAIGRTRQRAWSAFPAGTSVEAVLAAEGARRREQADGHARRAERQAAGQLDLLAT